LTILVLTVSFINLVLKTDTVGLGLLDDRVIYAV